MIRECRASITHSVGIKDRKIRRDAFYSATTRRARNTLITRIISTRAE